MQMTTGVLEEETINLSEAEKEMRLKLNLQNTKYMEV
jgi:hypothetical protein